MGMYLLAQFGNQRTVTYVNLRTGEKDQVGYIEASASTDHILAQVVTYCEPKPGDFFQIDFDGYRPDPLLFMPEAKC